MRSAVRLALLRAVGQALAARERRAHPAREPESRGRPLRLLLIRPDHLGDTLLASPAASVLRAALPEAEITWLVGPWAAEMATRAGSPATVETVEFPGFTRRPKASPVEPYALLWREAARLRAAAYDAALILRPDHWWGALLAAAAGIPRRIGYAVPECQPFLTDAQPPPLGHVVEANIALARAAARAFGGDLPPDAAIPRPSFAIRLDEDDWARQWIAKHLRHAGATQASPCTARPVVVVHPGSGAAVKNWPPERWVETLQRLRAERHASIVLTGGPGERDLVNRVAARLDPPPPTLAGETTLGQLAALFSHADLVLGTDSGPLHLAAAVGKRTVRVYGPTAVAEFGPWPPADAAHLALAAALPCQPCRDLIAPPCEAVELPACMRAISASDVATMAQGLLA
ncbi:MAG: glycosyltransferase family 9 protein [Chloroflexi bacterium]|nr:glycosyltransferase family 9 protein [Chloroflexota bacterium]